MNATPPSAKARTADLENQPYEAVVARLEEALERLEEGNLTLDEALLVYEEGMALAGRAQELLDTTEQRIEALRELGEG